MYKKIFSYLVVLSIIVTSSISCKKQLDVVNPNSPTPQQVENEDEVYALARGTVYVGGFQGISWLGDSYFSLCWGYHELMGDLIGAEASNNLINQINLPAYAIINGTTINLPASSRTILKANNFASKADNNPLFYEWRQMYALNNGCNYLIQVANKIKFANGDDDKNTILAWAYFWKGWAYSHIGSLYYAGVINEQSNIGTTGAGTGTNGNYVNQAAIIAEANKNYDKAITILNGVGSTAALDNVIPSASQTGLGFTPSAAEWIRNINSLKARNLIVNKLSPLSSPTITGSTIPVATAADWNQILTLANSGVQNGDNVFTGRSTEVNSFFSLTTGSIAAMSTRTNSSFKVSERWFQDFKAGDQRYVSNTRAGVYRNYVGGLTFSTSRQIIDAGRGATPPLSGVYYYSDKQNVGAVPLYICSSYEETELMKAEAKIRLGNISGATGGLSHVDNVRSYQGAGLPSVANAGLTQAQALEEVRSERRVALAFRGLSFYDARRWGYTYDVSKGGGRTNCKIYDPVASVLRTGCTINYNFIDYWDVPDNESSINKPVSGSAPIVNPN
jgi:starch-binding outer membrane protein, SusD/RagB family